MGAVANNAGVAHIGNQFEHRFETGRLELSLSRVAMIAYEALQALWLGVVQH